MGFSSPKAVAATPAPPPVTTTAAEVSQAEAETKRKQRSRTGYMDTLLTQGLGQDSGFLPSKPKKTLLGG